MELKKKYGGNFLGGIQKDNFSEKRLNNQKYKEVLLKYKEGHKNKYLNILKKCSIGVANQGLEHSIGWKMGEYLAHGMAIVSNPIEKFQLLGKFVDGENYLKYENVDDCVEKVDLLYKDKDLRENIQKNNRKYYHTYLRPDKKLQKLFNIISNKGKMGYNEHTLHTEHNLK